NIFRSPFAAAALRRVAGPRVQVESAGFLGPGRPAARDALAAAAGRGVDLSAHRSQLITAPLVQWADLIVVMDAVQRQTLCDRFGRTARDILMPGRKSRRNCPSTRARDGGAPAGPVVSRRLTPPSPSRNASRSPRSQRSSIPTR